MVLARSKVRSVEASSSTSTSVSYSSAIAPGMRVSTSSMGFSAWYATTKIRRRGRGARAADWRAGREKEIALSNLGKSCTSPSFNDFGEGGPAPGWRNSANSPWMICPTKSTPSEIGLALVAPLARLEHDRAASEHRQRIEERSRVTEDRAAAAAQLPRLSAWGN